MEDPRVMERIKHFHRQAFAIASAQNDNGAQLPIDQALREFLREYNGRNFKNDLWSMPSSFNVVEAFLEYTPAPSVFRLRKEIDHFVSYSSYLDYITSRDVEYDEQKALEYIEENTIYSFNFTEKPEDTLFSIDVNREFAVSGISMVRHGHEVSIILLAGLHTDTMKQSEELQRMDATSYKPAVGREDIAPADDLTTKAESLAGNKMFWRCLALSRIDYEHMTQGVRYILEDCGTRYNVITDDVDTFSHGGAKMFGDEVENLIRGSSRLISEHSALFELGRAALFLPQYFNQYSDAVRVERRRTAFRTNGAETFIRKRAKLVESQDRVLFRNVLALDSLAPTCRSTSIVIEPGINVEKNGYWKRLGYDKIGTDKNGEPITGKTWVSRTLSWVELEQTQGVHLVRWRKNERHEVGGDYEGSIYVLRNSGQVRNLFKIGMTTLAPEERAKQLQTTGVVGEFLLVIDWSVSDCRTVERTVHERLSYCRVDARREFFLAPLSEIVSTIESVISEMKANLDTDANNEARH